MSYYGKKIKEARALYDQRLHCEDCSFSMASADAGGGCIYCAKKDSVMPRLGFCPDGVPRDKSRKK